MARTPPRDQEALAALLVALRRFADGGRPANDFERGVLDSMQQNGAKPGVARNLVANFDKLVPAVRARALGPFASMNVPQRRQKLASGVGGGHNRGVIRVPHAIDLRGSAATIDDGRAVLGDNPPSDTTFTYEIRYVGLHCDEEVGDAGDFLFSTSDEVYAITSAVHINPDGTNEVRTEKHPFDRAEYDDVDVGETRLGPVIACWRGTNDQVPMSLTVVAFERDFGDPDKYRDEIDTAVKAALPILFWLLGVDSPPQEVLDGLSEIITDIVNWLIDTDDDQVDIAGTTILTLEVLERLGRRGRRRHIHTVHTPFGDDFQLPTELVSHFESRHSGLGGLYTFGFDIERTPPFVEDQPDVD